MAHRIRESRKAAGLTQEQLSEKADISPQYLSRLETARRLPSLDIIVDLAEALYTTPSALLEETQQDAQTKRTSKITAMFSALSEAEAAFLESQLASWISYIKDTRREP